MNPPEGFESLRRDSALRFACAPARPQPIEVRGAARAASRASAPVLSGVSEDTVRAMAEAARQRHTRAATRARDNLTPEAVADAEARRHRRQPEPTSHELLESGDWPGDTE